MIPLKKLKKGLERRKINWSTRDFLEIHRYLEAYMKRVFLISLRLNVVQYENSKNIVEHWHYNAGATLEKSIKLLTPSGVSQQNFKGQLESRYPDFFVLKQLFARFTSKQRNRLSHGAVGEFRDPKMLKCLCHTDQSFYREFERMLRAEFQCSAFDAPTAWGARVGKGETIKQVFERLRLSPNEGSPPMKLNDAQDMLGRTAYGLLMA